MSLRSDLEAYAPEDEQIDESHLTFANKLLRELRTLERHEAQVEELYQEERQRIDGWRADRMSGIERRQAELAERLEGFTRAWKERTGHAPPGLPNGVLRLTPPRYRLEVVDPEAFKDWAEGEHRLDFLRVKVDPAKDAIKGKVKPGPAIVGGEGSALDDERRQAVIEDEGVVVPGVELRRATQDSFTFKVAKTAEPDTEPDGDLWPDEREEQVR